MPGSPMSLSPPSEGAHPPSSPPPPRCRHQNISIAPATCSEWNHPRWKKILKSVEITVTGLAPIAYEHHTGWMSSLYGFPGK